ncbi:hypothetical protein LMG7974_01658 [Campylobacter majalis]|uniref:Phage tail collar domain-containing protein n=1 Tax=Campylobacter majalis TaxID=2790656 RepID=A0ABN7KAM3_9BACT|nr:phage tail protein [Campylobacter majalis]CAD7289581.1 hypothetical protein LMG7974_01658 [Campylobacter majalis]
MQYFSILTTIGLNKLIKATANSEQIILSKMGVSDDMGEISQDMQTLPNQKHKFSINSITQSDTDKNVLICEGVISADVGGFYIRKIGIYTSDDELFAVGNIPESYKPLLADGSAKDITIKFYLQVDNSVNIILKVDNNIVLATRNFVKDEFKKLNNELDAKFLPLHAKADDSHKLDGKDANEYALKSELSDGLPIGAYLNWSSQAKTPSGFLVCDGRSLNKSEYAELFEVIGYTYGGSDESFNIPKFDDGRFMRSVGGNALALGQLQQDAIRNITGKLGSEWGGVKTRFFNEGHGAFKNTPSEQGRIYAEGVSKNTNYADADFDASRVVPTANENRPLNSSVVVLIKAKDVKEPKANQIDDSIYATQAKAGIIKLKNSISGNAQDVAVTEKAVNEVKNQILGVNQTWQDVTSQRQVGITYTNTTGRPIQVLIALSTSINSQEFILSINNVDVNAKNGTSYNYGHTHFFSVIIPQNTTYTLKSTQAITSLKWFELR